MNLSKGLKHGAVVLASAGMLSTYFGSGAYNTVCSSNSDCCSNSCGIKTLPPRCN